MADDWRETLKMAGDKIANAAEVSILDKEVTGVTSFSSTPDTLFYTEFNENDAEAFFTIFSNFKELYLENPAVAIQVLADNLDVQISAMPKEICPTEILLFASRTVKEQIEQDPRVFKLLKTHIVRLLKRTPSKVIWYILCGWEWKPQLSILLEALGEYNNKELIDFAMKYYPHIAALCGEDDDRSPLHAYLNMLVSTQNERYRIQIADVVSNPMFSRDNDSIDFFIKVCKSSNFIKTEPFLSNLLEELDNRDIPQIFRKKLLRLQPRRDEESSLFNANMNSSLDIEHKLKELDNLEFGWSSSNDLFKCEKVRDKDGCILVCEKVIQCIDKIYPEEQRGRAYTLLGTKGRHCRENVIAFLSEQKAMYPEYTVPINIAFFSLRELTSNDLFDSLFDSFATNSYQPFWSKNVGKYFRYAKTAFSPDFIGYLSKRFIKSPENEDAIENYLSVLYSICYTFNGSDNRLNDSSLIDSLIRLLHSLKTRFESKVIYEKILDMLELIMQVSSSKNEKIMKYLDVLKDDLPTEERFLSVEVRINSLIKKGDLPIEPG